MADRPVVAHLAAIWSSTAGLLAGLDDKDWDRPTDCPGWTVRDQVSHVIGTEHILLGHPAPPAIDPATAPHVHNPLGQLNEAWVAERRDRSGPEILAELREVTDARLAALRSMSDEEMIAETNGPTGRVPYQAFMEIRVMDCWVHEQDIRRAVGRPGHFDGAAAEAALSRLTGSLGYVVGKRAGAGDGTTVVVRLEGPQAGDVAVRVSDGKARSVEAPAEPDLTLTMSAETYACLTCGRWEPADVLADGRVQVDGDQALAGRILEGMAIIP